MPPNWLRSDTVDAAGFDQGRELLKGIAIVTMTVDHVGLLFFPEYTIFRIVGRFAFPLFAYLLVLGMESTRSMRAYFTRLLVFAVLSQAPFTLVNGGVWWEYINIYATLLLGLAMVYLIERSSVLFVAPLVLSAAIPVDYGVYGTATVLLFYLLRRDWRVGAGVFVVLNLVLAATGAQTQPWSILALIPILLHSSGRLSIRSETAPGHPTFRKYFFYAYYPVHLALLYALKVFMWP